MGTLLLSFLPDQAMILVIIAAAFGLMVGIVSRRALAGVIMFVVLSAILGPFIDAIMDTLPLWFLIVLMGFFILFIIQTLTKSLFGKGASDNFMGHMLWALFSAPFRIIGYLVGIRRRL